MSQFYVNIKDGASISKYDTEYLNKLYQDGQQSDNSSQCSCKICDDDETICINLST